ncbi:MmcQ/YjbR family DNA-binding protein [Bacillus safensis]|nr:MmcQ/YjbR family DNA-binding protein [Bacillus safensis]
MSFLKELSLATYMNKTHWNSIYLDADISSSFVVELIEHSYQLVFQK